MAYRTKIIDYRYKKRVLAYTFPIHTGGKNQAVRKRYFEMSDEERIISDKRRLQYYRKKIHALVETAMMNSFSNMLTLTFAEDIQSYQKAKGYWRNFVRRLNWKYSDVKYICVWEWTKKGRVHFHVLVDIDINQKELSTMWRYGYVWINRIKDRHNRFNTMRYMTKYIVKSIQERVEDGSCERGERFYFCSKNLEKPIEEKLEADIDVQDVIFANMENMIRDGEYDMKDFNGNAINHISYAEFFTD